MAFIYMTDMDFGGLYTLKKKNVQEMITEKML